jgi:carbon-monoxide dehydrogenase medium subunit
MKPAAFRYLRPKTIGEAIQYLQPDNGDSRILAGGQSLVPMLNFRITRFDCLIDINYVQDLAYIRYDGEMLRIGAMTRQRTIETSSVVANACPLLQEVTKSIGHLPTRTRGTIGGSVAHADPAAEYPATLVALGATLVAQSSEGRREIAADEFFQDVYSTNLRADELLVEVAIPVQVAALKYGFEEYSRCKGDLPVIGIVGTFCLAMERITTPRLVAFGLASAPQRMRDAEAMLENRRPDEVECQEVASLVAAQVNAQDDVAATAELRKHLAGVLTRHVLISALVPRS